MVSQRPRVALVACILFELDASDESFGLARGRSRYLEIVARLSEHGSPE